MTPAPLYFTRQYLQARASDAGGPRGAEVVLAPARAEILRELGGVTAAVAGTHGKSSVGITHAPRSCAVRSRAAQDLGAKAAPPRCAGQQHSGWLVLLFYGACIVYNNI